jgi:hypothetical protein
MHTKTLQILLNNKQANTKKTDKQDNYTATANSDAKISLKADE